MPNYRPTAVWWPGPTRVKFTSNRHNRGRWIRHSYNNYGVPTWILRCDYSMIPCGPRPRPPRHRRSAFPLGRPKPSRVVSPTGWRILWRKRKWIGIGAFGGIRIPTRYCSPGRTKVRCPSIGLCIKVIHPLYHRSHHHNNIRTTAVLNITKVIVAVTDYSRLPRTQRTPPLKTTDIHLPEK